MKIKGILAIFILGILLVSAFACGGGEEEEATPTPTLTPTPTNMQAKLSVTVDAYIDWDTFEEEPIENALMVLNCSVTNVSDEMIENLSISLYVHDVAGELEFWFIENVDFLAPGDVYNWREETLVITIYFSEIGEIVAFVNGEEIAVHLEGVTP